MKTSLLLHICCGVCASRVIERLRPDFDIIGYFYNPNIEPPDEYHHRLFATETLTKYYGIKLVYGAYDTNMWHDSITGLEHLEEGGRRCWRCFRLRLEDTAERAKDENIRYFATTLTVSPYKNAKVINNLGNKVAQINGVKFIEVNFGPEDHYKSTLAQKLNLYRQKYCGCIYSAEL